MKTRLLVIVAALYCMIAVPAMAGQLTVVSFGGSYGKAQKKHMLDPYTAKTGVKILSEDYPGGIAEIKAQVEANNIQWDVVDMEMIDLERAASEGMLEPIPSSILTVGANGDPALKDFYPEALSNEYGVGTIFWSVMFAYNEATIGDAKPETIQDFFDVQKIPGKRALRKRPQVNLEWALIADGVALDKVYETLATDAGLARAFKKLATIKDDIVWFDSWSQVPQLLNDGGAVMAQAANGRIFNAIKKDGKPFKMVWDAQVFDLDVWAVVKGSKNKEQAFDFIAYTTGTKPLSGMEDVAYGPTRASAMELVSPDVVPDLPTSHLKEGIKADGVFWADYGESVGEKFNEWLMK